MIGNLLHVRERLVATPDVTGLNVGDCRVGARESLFVERRCLEVC